MIEPAADPATKPALLRALSLEPNSLLNLEWQQEICDDISRFGREKFVRFMELVAKDRSLSGRAISYLEQRPIRTWISFISAILGALSALLYISSTYVVFEDDVWFQSQIEVFIGFVFLTAFLTLVMLDGMNYLWSLPGIFDLLTNWPSVVSIVFLSSLSHSSMLYSATRLLRLLRLRYVVSVTEKVSGAIARQVLAIFATIFTLGIVAAGILQFHEFYNNNRYWPFHDCVYLMILNITTVGPGDVRLLNTISRYMVLVTVAISFSLLPLQITHLVRLWPPDKTRAASTQSRGRHVVVILPQDFTVDEIDDFLGELFHSNHGSTVFNVVLLSCINTNRTLMQALRRRPYLRHLTFLSGSPYEDRDLQRSNLSAARAVFVLSRRSCESLEHENEEDIHTMMAAVSVKNYCPTIPTIVQINNPENGASVLWRNLAAFPNTQLLCVKQVKMALLAGSCVCPGLHVLVSNMLQSFVARVNDTESWHKEYIWGATNALFPTVFGSYFQGKRFLEAAVELYMAIDVMPIAVFKRHADTQNIAILLGPIDHIIQDGDLVYVLSRDLESASMVATYPNRLRRHASTVTSKLMKSSDLAASFQMSRQSSLRVVKAIPASNVKPGLATSELLEGHVVICGYIDGSVIDLICTLRKQALSRTIPVVIIFESPPSADLYTALSSFQDISIIVGSLQDTKTLSAANLTSANHVLLLANPFAKAQGDAHDQVVRVDFDSIVSLLELENYLHSKTHRADTNMMVEILFLSNLRFIRPNFSYNAAALSELSSGFDGLRLPQLAAADGKIHASGMLQSIAAFSFYSPHILTIIDALIYGNGGQDNRRIVLVEIPSRMIGDRYAAIVQRLADEYGALAIGLFRSRTVRRSPVPYVFTKPPTDTIVSASDRVYVLGSVSFSQKPVIRKLMRDDLDEGLPVIMSTYSQHQENLESSVHMFQQALRSRSMAKAELFEPDLPAWVTQIRSWWRSATRQMEFSSWKSEPSRHRAREPHDYREFMKERNLRLGITTQTSRDCHESSVFFREPEPFDYDDVRHVELSGLNSAHFMSESLN